MCCKGNRGFGRFWGVFSPICLNGALLSKNVLDFYMKVDNISVRTIYRWKHHFIGFLAILSGSRSKQGFTRNMQKCNSCYTQKISPNCTLQRDDVMATIMVTGVVCSGSS